MRAAQVAGGPGTAATASHAERRETEGDDLVNKLVAGLALIAVLKVN
jgi:hypothetical protein